MTTPRAVVAIAASAGGIPALQRVLADLPDDHATAVVLTGSGSNGAGGVTHVPEAGGAVIAQDRATSEHFNMPSAAIKTGVVDFVLPLDRIGAKIVELVERATDARHN